MPGKIIIKTKQQKEWQPLRANLKYRNTNKKNKNKRISHKRGKNRLLIFSPRYYFVMLIRILTFSSTLWTYVAWGKKRDFFQPKHFFCSYFGFFALLFGPNFLEIVYFVDVFTAENVIFCFLLEKFCSLYFTIYRWLIESFQCRFFFTFLSYGEFW